MISISVIIGFAVLFEGISNIVNYFINDDKNVWELVLGIINTIFGLLILSSRFFLLISAILLILLGLWVTFKGVIKIIGAIYIKKIRPQSWLPILISGILSLFIGVIMLFNPVLPIIAISGLFSIGLILSGISLVFSRI